METRGKLVIVAALVALMSAAVAFTGVTRSFQTKVDYLSDRYLIYDGEWESYIPSMQSYMMKEGYYIEFETLQAGSWVAFKSLLREAEGNGSFSGSLSYDQEARIIWFAQLTEVLGSRCWYTIWTFR